MRFVGLVDVSLFIIWTERIRFYLKISIFNWIEGNNTKKKRKKHADNAKCIPIPRPFYRTDSPKNIFINCPGGFSWRCVTCDWYASIPSIDIQIHYIHCIGCRLNFQTKWNERKTNEILTIQIIHSLLPWIYSFVLTNLTCVCTGRIAPETNGRTDGLTNGRDGRMRNEKIE